MRLALSLLGAFLLMFGALAVGACLADVGKRRKGIELVPSQEPPAGWTPPRAGLDWFDAPPPVTTPTDQPPTDFDG